MLLSVSKGSAITRDLREFALMLLWLLEACLFGFISFNVFGSSTLNNAMDVVDPSRIAAQIVSGIGFLGARVILRDKGRIHGLTTGSICLGNSLYMG